MLDIAIIGAGPAGLSAAINGVIRNKKVKVFGRKPKTSLLYKAENVANYLGLPNLTGKKMIDEFVDHSQKKGVEIEESTVTEIYNMGDYYNLNVNGDFIETKTVIIATGIPNLKFYKGEEKYIGRGVSYCATCDGMLYREKDIFVVAKNDDAYEEISYLQDIVKKVYLITNKDIDGLKENVEVIEGKISEIIGDESVAKGVVVNNQKYLVSGVFILRETTPVTQLIKGIEMKSGSIKVNRSGETNFDGIYAAGDCTGKPFQVAKAVGEGATAALKAVSYITEKEKAKVLV